MVAVRPFADDDDVRHLGGLHGPDRDEPRRARTYVAEIDGEVVGAATLMWSTRHPDLVSATIDVAASARRHGTGTALLAHVEEEADRPLLFNVEQSTESAGFLESAGFDVAVTSVTSRVVVAEVLELLDIAHPAADADADADSGSVTIVARHELDASLVEWYETTYAERHRWAGRYTPLSDAPWIEFAGEVLDVPGAIQTAVHDGKLVAVASLHGGPFAGGADAFVPPTSALSGSHEARSAVLTRVLRALLRAGLDAGLEEVTVEYDSTYDDLTAVMSTWPTVEHAVRHVWLRQNTANTH